MRRLSLFPVLSLLFATVAAFIGLWWTGESDTARRRWRAFDLILVSQEFDIHQVHRELRRHGLEPLDITNATVRIEDFNGQERIGLSELSHRFDDADPRLDPFVRDVTDLFESRSNDGAFHLVYLPREESAKRRYREIRSALGPIPFRLDGRVSSAGILGATVAIGVLAVVTVLSRRRLVMSLGVISAAGLYVYAHGPLTLVPAVLTALAVLYLLRHSRVFEREWLTHGSTAILLRDHVRTITFAAGSVAASVVVSFINLRAGTGRVLPYILYLLAIAGLYGLSLEVARLRYRRREHRLFSPRPILEEPWRERRPLTKVFPGLVVSVFFLAGALIGIHFLSRGGLFEGDVFVPVPEHRIFEPGPVTSADVGSELLAMLSPDDAYSSPLSVAGFLAHRRFQSSVLFDGEYAVPLPDESVQLQRFRRNDGRIETWEEEQIRFDGEWVYRQYEGTEETVYNLFVREGGLFTVVWDRLYVVNLPPELVLVQLILLFGVLFPVLVPIRLPYRNGIGTVAVASRSERR